MSRLVMANDLISRPSQRISEAKGKLSLSREVASFALPRLRCYHYLGVNSYHIFPIQAISIIAVSRDLQCQGPKKKKKTSLACGLIGLAGGERW